MYVYINVGVCFTGLAYKLTPLTCSKSMFVTKNMAYQIWYYNLKSHTCKPECARARACVIDV